MEYKKVPNSKYKANKLLISLIRLSFFGIGIGILSGSFIKSLKHTESDITKDLSLIENKSILIDSIEEIRSIKRSTIDSIKSDSSLTSIGLHNDDLTKNKINVNEDNKIYLYPLKAISPTILQLKGLIEAWLEGKARILAGGESDILSRVARNNLVNIVNLRREEDKESKEFQIIKARIESLIIKERTSKRIEVSTKISYEDKRLKLSGELIGKTSPSTLKINYILGRKNQEWRLIDFFMVD